MKAQPSLGTFYQTAEPTTLDACDSEQIHLSGRIQNIAGLIAADPATGTVIAVSDNIARFLDISATRALGQNLSDLAPHLDAVLQGEDVENDALHQVLDIGLDRDGTAYDTITHLHDGVRYIEFLPNQTPNATEARRKMRLAGRASARILQAETFAEALEITTDTARQICGFDRVKIYRFLPDWSGNVVAESRAPGTPSFAGLHFPASDIPRQVRAIMTLVPYRAIGTISDATIPLRVLSAHGRELDLSWSITRSVSQMHTAYLRNMGVQASFSCSLLHHGKLWGLIAAHHSEEALVPFDAWCLMQEIGASLMLRFDQEERALTSDKIAELRRIENHFAASLREGDDIEDVIENLVPVLQRFLNADGFAFQYGTTLYTSGATPPREVIPDIIRWAMQQLETSDQFQTNALHRDWPPARDHIETACGVLIQPIATHRVCQLIWFRGPITKTVHWAGRPVKKGDGDDDLGPRRSFETWIDEHREESRPWQVAELESAKEIFKEFLDIIASQMLLKDKNQSLRTFAALAAHDIKAPLMNISSALQLMEEDAFEEGSVKEFHAIAEQQAKRLMAMTEGLLDLALLNEQMPNVAPFALGEAVNAVGDMLSMQLREADGKLDIGPLPTIQASRPLMERVFLNLIGNAIKYRDVIRPLAIRIRGDLDGASGIEVSVADRGIGIAPEHAEKIMEPMQRLHSYDHIEGAGLGLAISRAIVEKHGGTLRLDTGYTGGARFVIRLPVTCLVDA